MSHISFVHSFIGPRAWSLRSSANHSFLSDVPPPMAPRPRRSTVSDRSTPALKAVGLRMPNLDELRESYASTGPNEW